MEMYFGKIRANCKFCESYIYPIAKFSHEITVFKTLLLRNGELSSRFRLLLNLSEITRYEPVLIVLGKDQITIGHQNDKQTFFPYVGGHLVKKALEIHSCELYLNLANAYR